MFQPLHLPSARDLSTSSTLVDFCAFNGRLFFRWWKWNWIVGKREKCLVIWEMKAGQKSQGKFFYESEKYIKEYTWAIIVYVSFLPLEGFPRCRACIPREYIFQPDQSTNYASSHLLCLAPVLRSPNPHLDILSQLGDRTAYIYLLKPLKFIEIIQTGHESTTKTQRSFVLNVELHFSLRGSRQTWNGKKIINTQKKRENGEGKHLWCKSEQKPAINRQLYICKW